MVVDGLDNVLLQEAQESLGVSSTVRLDSFSSGRCRGSGSKGGFDSVVGRELSCKVGGEGRCFGCRGEGEGLDSTDVGVLGCWGGGVGLDFAEVEVLNEVFVEPEVREVCSLEVWWKAYPCERQRRWRTRVGKRPELVEPVK